jgi:anhydro-N-acetylmuramic acid kinase
MPFSSLADIKKKLEAQTELIVLGLMSGTSMDGLDIAVCSCSHQGIRLLGLHTYEFPTKITHYLKNLAQAQVRDLAELNYLIGSFFGYSAKDLISKSKYKIDLIGSHGQTVYHHSRVKDRLRTTLQLGDADIISVYSGVPVVSDFRQKDIALGGEGAPLVPLVDELIYGSSSELRAILNIGGIANLTFFPTKKTPLTAFDTGPGNAPLDRLTKLLTQSSKDFDVDGLIAAGGKVDKEFATILLNNDNYVNLKPPKSTGFEMYGDSFVNELCVKFGFVNADLLATATYFVALSIAHSVKNLSPYFVEKLIVSGGGALNGVLIAHLRELLPNIEVVTSDSLGIPVKAREAMGFAALAYCFISEKPLPTHNFTGALRESVLGKLSLPN